MTEIEPTRSEYESVLGMILQLLKDLEKPQALAGDEALLTEKETAKELRVKEQTLALWRSKSVGPEYIKVGSAVRYQLGSIRKYLQQQKVTR